MKDFFQKYQHPLYLFSISILWIIVINFFLQIFNQNYIYPDTESYIKASMDLYLLHKPNDIRPSLIAAINGFPLLFGLNKTTLFHWNMLVNLFLWIAAVLLIYNFCSKLTTKKVAFYLSLIYIFTLGSLLIVFEFLSETVFTFFLLISLVLFQKYDVSKRIFFLAFGFSTLVLSMLIKPASLLLFIGVCVFFGIVQLKSLIRSKSSILVYVSVFIVFCHLALMKYHYGNFTISYIDSFTYYNYLGTKADCLKTGKEFVQCNNERYNYFNTFSLPEGKKVACEDIKNQVSNNTLNLIKAYCLNMIGNSSKASGYFYIYENKNDSTNFEVYKLIFRGISRLNTLFYSLIGLLLSIIVVFSKKTAKIIKITAFTIIYIIAISAISSDQADRFHIVIYPFTLILIAYYFSNKSKQFSEQLQK
jgi:4-amino-4-deoxy-L-arabinose transferase-like glycosyltransferase